MSNPGPAPQKTIQQQYQALFEHQAAHAAATEKYHGKTSAESSPSIPSVKELLKGYKPLTVVRDAMSNMFYGRPPTMDEAADHKSQYLDAQMAPILEQHGLQYAEKAAALTAAQSFNGRGYGILPATNAPIPAQNVQTQDGIDADSLALKNVIKDPVFSTTLTQAYKFHRGAASKQFRSEYAKSQRKAHQEAGPEEEHVARMKI